MATSEPAATESPRRNGTIKSYEQRLLVQTAAESDLSVELLRNDSVDPEVMVGAASSRRNSDLHTAEGGVGSDDGAAGRSGMNKAPWHPGSLWGMVHENGIVLLFVLFQILVPLAELPLHVLFYFHMADDECMPRDFGAPPPGADFPPGQENPMWPRELNAIGVLTLVYVVTATIQLLHLLFMTRKVWWWRGAQRLTLTHVATKHRHLMRDRCSLPRLLQLLQTVGSNVPLWAFTANLSVNAGARIGYVVGGRWLLGAMSSARILGFEFAAMIVMGQWVLRRLFHPQHEKEQLSSQPVDAVTPTCWPTCCTVFTGLVFAGIFGVFLAAMYVSDPQVSYYVFVANQTASGVTTGMVQFHIGPGGQRGDHWDWKQGTLAIDLYGDSLVTWTGLNSSCIDAAPCSPQPCLQTSLLPCGISLLTIASDLCRLP